MKKLLFAMLVASVYLFAACTNNTQKNEAKTETECTHNHEGHDHECQHHHDHEGQEEFTADTTAVEGAQAHVCSGHKDGEKCQHADSTKCCSADKADATKTCCSGDATKCDKKGEEATKCCASKK